MWSEFWIAVAAATALLYVPGFLFFKGMRFSTLLALCCAPLYSVLAYAAIPIAYEFAGVPCSTLTLTLPTFLVALACFFISLWRAHRNGTGPETLRLSEVDPLPLGTHSVPFDAVAPLASVAVAAIACYVVFIRSMAQPDGFVCIFDNQTHLNGIRAFLDSGRWSSLHLGPYIAAPSNATPYTSNAGSFYPAGWHCLVALMCDAFGFSVTVGVNVVLTCMCMIMLPLGSYAFMRALFPSDRSIVLLGVFAVFSFANYPWRAFLTGPLYPNVFGLMMLTSSIAWIVAAIDSSWIQRHVGRFIANALVTFGCLAFAHPNTIFSLYVFMAAYGITVIGRSILRSTRLKGFLKYVCLFLALALFCAVIVAIWVGIYHIPRFQGVVGHLPESFLITVEAPDFWGTAIKALTANKGALLVCAVCVVALPLVLRHDNWPMLLLPAIFFSVAFVAIRSGMVLTTYWTSALWYSDSRRLAFNVAIFNAPILTLMLDALIHLPRRFHRQSESPAGRHSQSSKPVVDKRASVFTTRVLPALILVGYCAAVILVSYRGIVNSMRDRYNVKSDHVYNTEEIAFVNEAREITEGDLVLNSPNDGSLWAYGVNGLNTYYREFKFETHTSPGKTIRLRLSSYSKNSDVQRAVEYTGARYVLLLDKDVAYKEGKWLGQYRKQHIKEWAGIDAVDDNTPGFELVLKRGDMRLYRIQKLE